MGSLRSASTENESDLKRVSIWKRFSTRTYWESIGRFACPYGDWAGKDPLIHQSQGSLALLFRRRGIDNGSFANEFKDFFSLGG